MKSTVLQEGVEPVTPVVSREEPLNTLYTRLNLIVINHASTTLPMPFPSAPCSKTREAYLEP